MFQEDCEYILFCNSNCFSVNICHHWWAADLLSWFQLGMSYLSRPAYSPLPPHSLSPSSFHCIFSNIKQSSIKTLTMWSSLCGSVEANTTSIHEDVSLIPGFTHWVGDPKLLWPVVWASSYSSDSRPSLGTFTNHAMALKNKQTRKPKFGYLSAPRVFTLVGSSYCPKTAEAAPGNTTKHDRRVKNPFYEFPLTQKKIFPDVSSILPRASHTSNHQPRNQAFRTVLFEPSDSQLWLRTFKAPPGDFKGQRGWGLRATESG